MSRPNMPAPPKVPKLPPGYKSWEDYWKFKSKLNLQNPMLTMNAPTNNAEDKKQQDDDDEKKRKRIAEIKAKAKKKAKGKKTSISSGTGTVSPILYSYPSSGVAETSGGGFSLANVPSIVWIVLAVGVGIFMIKSAGRK